MPKTRNNLIAVALLLACAPPAWAGDGTFVDGQELAFGLPASLAVGDFNSDGRSDIAVAGAGDDVYVWLGSPTRELTATVPVPVGKNPEHVVAADFNADGRDDLAVANIDSKNVSVRLGDGTGRFSAAPDVPLERTPRSMVAADFNADGREDLAVPNTSLAGGPRLSVLIGSGDGKFPTAVHTEAKAAALTPGDFNADGVEDLAYGAFGTSPAGVLVGTGGGNFAAGGAIDLSDSANAARAWATGDFNSDGRDDVVAAVSGDQIAAVRLGRGDGSFTGAPDVPAGAYPYAPAVGDFNSDGREDIAVVSSDDSSDAIAIKLGDGAGGFSPASDVPIVDGAGDVAVADFDGDGNDDLVAAAYNAGEVAIRYGAGPAPLAGNLLANGGFEGPDAAATATQSPEIPGWQRRGGATYARYGLQSSSYFPARLDSPRFMTGGGSFFWGGNSATTDGVTEAFQTVDVAAASPSIDAGLAQVRLSGYLGGALAYGDRASVRAEFLDAGGTVLGTSTIGPLTAADRRGLTTLQRRTETAAVPAGTRQIRVTLTSIDDDKTYSSATVDNVKLTLDAPEPAREPEPQPQPQPAAFGTDTRVRLKLSGRKGRRVRVRVTNGNPFAVTGTLNRKRKLDLRPGAGQTAKLRLSRPQRRRLRLRLTAVVRDPAGNSRTVSKRVRLRRR